MKIILTTRNIKKDSIQNLKFNKSLNALIFTVNKKEYKINIETPQNSFIKVKDSELQIINNVAVCNNSTNKNLM